MGPIVSPGDFTDTINQGLWNEMGNGTVTIRFYINDTLGNIDFDDVTIRKDILAPNIMINSPTAGELFGNTTITFDISITEGNLNDTWYTINNGATNTTFDYPSETTILQSIWDAAGNGTVTIIFYANDTFGNVGSSQVNIFKDSILPTITINTPVNKTYYEDIAIAPKINVTVYEANIDTIWYTVSGNNTIITLVNNTELTIDLFIWNNLIQGAFQIRIYANDSAGNINDTLIYTLYKDTEAPDIIINSPLEGQTVGTSAPDFSLTIIEVRLNTTWYRLWNGTAWSNNYTVEGTTGTINQTLWNSIPDQTIVQIMFYANDSLGRLDETNVNVTKSLPVIPPVEDDDDDKKKEEKKPELIDQIITALTSIFTDFPNSFLEFIFDFPSFIPEFISDLTTNPANLLTNRKNMIFLGLITGIAIALFIGKRAKSYKTSKKKVKRIQEIIESE